MVQNYWLASTVGYFFPTLIGYFCPTFIWLILPDANIKSKFARGMLCILKTTQDITPEKWLYVPLQDFTPNSDINWNTSIANIDKQLYKKYGLTAEEIQFIETNVKEMV